MGPSVGATGKTGQREARSRSSPRGSPGLSSWPPWASGFRSWRYPPRGSVCTRTCSVASSGAAAALFGRSGSGMPSRSCRSSSTRSSSPPSVWPATRCGRGDALTYPRCGTTGTRRPVRQSKKAAMVRADRHGRVPAQPGGPDCGRAGDRTLIDTRLGAAAPGSPTSSASSPRTARGTCTHRGQRVVRAIRT